MRNGWRVVAIGAALAASALPAGALNLPFGLGQRDRAPSEAAERVEPKEAPIRLAQVGDSGQRISQLEEENRRLNGKLEELSFQVLQMQEQMRKMQEDTDFRFRDLEGGAKPAATGTQKRSDVVPPPASGDTATATAAPPAGAPTGNDEIGSLLGESGGLDTGTVTNSAPARPAAAAPSGTPSNTVASIQTKNAGELYGLAYNYLLAGDYQLAESSFRQYTQTYPDAKDVPDARYWLGESQYQQTKYADAAETFLNAQKDYPKSPKAPEMMLKLGMSLAKLDNRDTACVTFREVSRRYPQMSATVKRKLQTETQAAKCGA